MIELLKKIYHKYSHTRFFEFLVKIYRNGFIISNFMAYLRLKKVTKKANSINGKITVIFLCQNTVLWNKHRIIFENMQNDDRYSVKILAVPEINSKNKNEFFEYYKNIYSDKVIDARKGNGWFDLKELQPDYVFLQRPYDQYLPKEYRSKTISSYTKVCYLTYGYSLIRILEGLCMDKLFFRNVYMYFAENKIYYNYNIKRFKKSHNKGYRKTLNIGYPSLQDFVNKKSERNKSEKFNVVWTPRWSEDKEVGGGNFLNFKDKILNFAKLNEKIDITFRPHPMTFKHFVSINKMTEKEVEDYIENFKVGKNLNYDDQPDFDKTFWNSDALLTDASSVIIEYLLTGKPIIYCDAGSQPDDFMLELLKVFYVVNTWEEAEKKVIELSNGIDPLKENRALKVKEMLGEDFTHISDRFLNEIYNDFIGKK